MKNAHIVLLFLLALMVVQSVRAADIVALCIGNDAYIREEDVLDTPVADARLMKQALEALPGGADVTLLTDASRADIVIALNALKDRARGAKLALVFYSGHGMDGQPRGYQNEDTFLLPVEAVIPSEDHLAVSAVGLREVLAALKDCPVTARAVILDCCRTGAPKATGALVAGGTKNFGQLDERVKVALGKAVVPEATLVAFAASPGRKAAAFLSDQDANSPFTRFLAEELGTGVGNLRDLVEAAAEQTELATERRQMPYVSYNGSINAIKQIVFRTAVATVPSSTIPAMSEAEIERRARELAVKIAAEEKAKAAPMALTTPVTAPAFPASRGMEGSRAGEVREFGGIEMVWCPAGEFVMGSPASEEGRDEDETQHGVKLTRGFWLAKTETTQGQWESVMGSDVAALKASGVKDKTYGEVNATGRDVAMYFTSWEDAQGYLAKLNGNNPLPAGWKWDLPTEAQWEYACRAGTETATYYGALSIKGKNNAPALDPIAWYGGNSSVGYTDKGFDTSGWEEKQYPGGTAGAREVGLKKANDWGLHDMHGNVFEWCRDWYGDYPSGVATNPTGATTGSSRVPRGGSWLHFAAYCRSANRYWFTPDSRSFSLGFRVAAVPAGR